MKKLLISILIAACIYSPAWANSDYEFEVVKQPQQAGRFNRLMAYTADEGTRIFGRYTTSRVLTLPKGHIDIAAYSSSGTLLVETTSGYVPSILTYRARRKGGVRFYVDFDQIMPSGTIFKIGFHCDEPLTQKNPTHVISILN